MYIFLDIDGVFNTTSDWKHYKYQLRTDLIENFATVFCNISSPKIILISSWRFGFNFDIKSCSPQIQELISKLKEYDLSIIGATSLNTKKDRGSAILDYLSYHKSNSYIIIDDDISEYKTKVKNLYLVNADYGFSKHDAKEVKKWIKHI